MTSIETIRQKMHDEEAQVAQRAAAIEATREKISSLENQIDDAVERGNVKEVEKLEEQQVREKAHLATLERFNAHKLDPARYRSELEKICAAKKAELQPIADKACEEVKKAEKILLEKKIAFVKILNEAAAFRTECSGLAGVGFIACEDQLNGFDSVEFENIKTEIGLHEKALMLQLDPDFFFERGNARNYLHFKQIN